VLDGRLTRHVSLFTAQRSGASRHYRSAAESVQEFSPDLIQARFAVSRGDYDALEALYDSVPQVLAECVRTAFIPASGYKMIVADFSAIECRVLAWLAGEKWVLDVFEAAATFTARQLPYVPCARKEARC
jgi:DNA polymerase